MDNLNYNFPSSKLIKKESRWKVWIGGAVVGAVIMAIVDYFIYMNFIINHFN